MPVAPTATATPDTKRVGGSRGADLVAGAREVKIPGDHVPGARDDQCAGRVLGPCRR